MFSGAKLNDFIETYKFFEKKMFQTFALCCYLFLAHIFCYLLHQCFPIIQYQTHPIPLHLTFPILLYMSVPMLLHLTFLILLHLYVPMFLHLNVPAFQHDILPELSHYTVPAHLYNIVPGFMRTLFSVIAPVLSYSPPYPIYGKARNVPKLRTKSSLSVHK